MRRHVVAANWKMNGSSALVAEMASVLYSARLGDVDVVVMPPALYVAALAQRLTGSSVTVGVQNVSDRDEAALTGEVSVRMSKDCGASHVLVGHSERRQQYGESNELITSKFSTIKAVGLVPVLCVGETLAERRANRAEAVVIGQLAVVVDDLGIAALTDAIVAYEPVWAIGTGETATPDQAQAMHAVIRRYLTDASREVGEDTRILYGGSVKPDSAGALFEQADIDGGLVGGASLVAEDFLMIIEAAG